MTDREPRKDWPGQTAFSFLLAFGLHSVLIFLFLFGPRLGLPGVMELNQDLINQYRERIYREMAAARQARHAPPPLLLSVDLQDSMLPAKYVSKPRQEEELDRARSVQRAIATLWESMTPQTPGYALVSLRILEQGGLGDFVVSRISGEAEFQAFLHSFLSRLKNNPGNLAEPGPAMWIECEFVVQPQEGSTKP